MENYALSYTASCNRMIYNKKKGYRYYIAAENVIKNRCINSSHPQDEFNTLTLSS